MSLSVYSAQSAEANRLKFGGFEIYYDQKNDTVIIKTGNEKVYFNTLYNKEEVDQLIAQGVDPSSFEEWIFNRVMLYSFATGSAVGVVNLKELLDYLSRDMQALKELMDEKVDSRNVVDFNEEVKPAENKIYNASSIYDFLILLLIKLIKRDDVVAYKAEVEPAANQIYNALSLFNVLKEVLTTNNLVLWDQNIRPEKESNIYNAQSLWDKITSIRECKCNPEMMEELAQIMERLFYIPNSDLDGLPTLEFFGNLHLEGGYIRSHNSIERSVFKYRPADSDSSNVYEESYIDYETDYAPFDPENPIYGKYFMPCHIQINGTINGIHTADILTKDDIDDLGASHFLTVEGAPPFTVSNECLKFENILDGNIADRIELSLPEEVINYLKTLNTETNVIEVRLRKLQVYDEAGNLVLKTYIKYKSSTWTVFNLAKNEQGVLQIHFETSDAPRITSYESAELLLKDLYTEGIIVFSYALSETCIQSDRDVVKCNIIDAKNAFKLVETDQLYLYEPTIIDEKTVGDVDFWYQLYHIDSSTNIIDGQKFELVDHYTGFSFELQWNSEENKWKGFNNVHSTRFVSGGAKDTPLDPSLFEILILKSDIHELWFSSLLNVIDGSKNWVEELWTKGKIKFILEAPNGTQTDITHRFMYRASRTDNINGKTYYRGSIQSSQLVKEPGITENHLILGLICINEDSVSKLEWKAYRYATDMWGGRPLANIADQLNLRYGVELESTTGNTKDIELFIRKDVLKIDSTLKAIGGNIFDAINRKKYYQVKPYPESCSTLYTDLCIQSSKIITADNITTMAADLNYVQNFSYDLEAMIESVNNKLNTFIEELKEQQERTAAINAVVGGFMIMSSGLTLIGNAMSKIGELSFLAEEGMELETTIRGNTTYIKIGEEGGYEMNEEVFPFNIFDTDESSVETVIDYAESNTDLDWSDFSDVSNGEGLKKTNLVFKDWVSLTPKLLNDGTEFYTEEMKGKYENYTVSMTGTLRLINTLQQWTADYINALHKRIRPMEHIFANCTPVKIIDQKCLIKNESTNLLEVDLKQSFVKVASISFKENERGINVGSAEKEIAIEAKTLVLNKLMIQNLADEQLLIKNEVSNVLFSLSRAVFENPVAIHDTLTATTIVCDELKNTENHKYLTEGDIDLDIMKEVIKVLQDDRIQINCTQLHCDLITNTAFEPYALEKNHYTKTEADEKFALKNELSAPDLSEYITKEEVEKGFVVNDLEPELVFNEGTISSGSWKSVCYGNNVFVAISYEGKFAWSEDGKTFTEGTLGSNGWNSICFGNGLFVAVGSNKCAWSEDGKTFTEGRIISGLVWTSVCYGNGVFVAVSAGNKCAWSEDGKTFTQGTILISGEWKSVCYENGVFVAVNMNGKCAWSTDGKTFTGGTISKGFWLSVCYDNGVFVAVSNDGKCAWSTDGKTFTDGTISSGSWKTVCYGNGVFVTISYDKFAWSEDGKTFTDGIISLDKLQSVCFGNNMFVAVGENGQCAWSSNKYISAKSFALKEELEEYVATETLEDVVSQINSKFDSQKRRWTFKLTMNANTSTTTLDLSESIDEYNPVLSNSDGKHVFVYQETNNGFEMIVLTVTLSALSLNVQADKQSKNNYEVYLSFDEL